MPGRRGSAPGRRSGRRRPSGAVRCRTGRAPELRSARGQRGQALEDAALLAVPDLGHGAGGAGAAGPLVAGDARTAAPTPRFGDVDRSPATYVEVAGIVKATGHHLRRLVSMGGGGAGGHKRREHVNAARRYRRSDMEILSLRGQGPVCGKLRLPHRGVKNRRRVSSTDCAPRTCTTRVEPSSCTRRAGFGSVWPCSSQAGSLALDPGAQRRRAAMDVVAGLVVHAGGRRVGEQHVGGRQARPASPPPPPRSTRCRPSRL